ncbi:Tripartite DNA replication factor [Podila epigama]|nr:Tripartite DNA replication factor [Podila epigama]
MPNPTKSTKKPLNRSHSSKSLSSQARRPPAEEPKLSQATINTFFSKVRPPLVDASTSSTQTSTSASTSTPITTAPGTSSQKPTTSTTSSRPESKSKGSSLLRSWSASGQGSGLGLAAAKGSGSKPGSGSGQGSLRPFEKSLSSAAVLTSRSLTSVRKQESNAKAGPKQKLSRPKTIIIDDEDDIDVDGGVVKVAKAKEPCVSESNNGKTKDSTTVVAKEHGRPSALSSTKQRELVPFEERMPASSRQDADEASPSRNADSASNSSPSRTSSTPRTTISPIVTPQRPAPSSNVFRTPTEKSRRKGATFESLGLSPEDSVFWVKTPPMEAFKKLGSLDSGRSHEEGEESSSGVAYLFPQMCKLRQLLGGFTRILQPAQHFRRWYFRTGSWEERDSGPKDRIRDMLDTLRGNNFVSSSQEEDNDDEDELDRFEHPSPTRNIASRQHLQERNHVNLSESASSHTSQIIPRKRGRNNRARQLNTFRIKGSTLAPSATRPHVDVLRMIEQLKANMSNDSSGTSAGLSGRPQKRHFLEQSDFLDVQHDSTTQQQDEFDVHGGSTNMVRTPTKTLQTARVNTSPDEFDSFFNDFEMGADDLEELTQMELSATMSAASSSLSTVSCPLSSRASSTDTVLPRMVQGMLQTTDVSSERKSSDDPFSSATRHSKQQLAQDDQPATVNTRHIQSNEGMDDFDGLEGLDEDFSIDEVQEVGLAVESAKYKRYTVEDVRQDVADARWPGLCSVITGREEGVENAMTIYLRESWIASHVNSGDIVHTVGALIYSKNERIIDNANGFLIIRPDHLISTSILAGSFTCMRKAVLDSRIIRPYDLTLPLIHGNVLHELFQQCLRTNNFSTASMEEKIDNLVNDHLKELCLINESIDAAKAILREQIPSCQTWARRFLRSSPASDSVVLEHLGASTEIKKLSINKVLDIEENIWSPTFGLKGKIDATVQVVLSDDGQQNNATTLTVPLELKTGKSSHVMSHRAQTMLYTLLMTDRYDINVQWGLLFYMKTEEFIRVSAPRDEIRTIMMHRNELAQFEENRLKLPPMLANERTCQRCFSVSSCMVMHKTVEAGTGLTAGISSKFDELTGHLRKNHADFLTKWNGLLTLEQGDISKFRREIWSMTSSSRAAVGHCFSNMVLLEVLANEYQPPDHTDISTSGVFGRHRYRFGTSTHLSQNHSQSQRQSQSCSTQLSIHTGTGGQTLLGSSISVGDPIVVSSESQQYALAVGYVLDMSPTELIVGLDRPLLGPPMRQDGFDATCNQTYHGILDLSRSRPHMASVDEYQQHLNKNSVMFRIDKDAMAAGLARTRNNLVQLFLSDEDGGDAKRRQLVVDLEPPVFDANGVFPSDLEGLNCDQRAAVEKVLTAQDYALILGMPGTGKTTTIAQIIHTLVNRGKSVLLTSYTHSAVDNVLLKLHPAIEIMRIGSRSKVHRDAQKFVPDFSQPPLNTVEGLHNYYGRCQVVGTTCLGIADAIFAEKRFDYCIVDEASQITLPVCLGPLRYANTFVLVGDHNQLPPLVKNQEARENGFEVSLFKVLSDAHPQAIVRLTHQYRMNKHIMHLSNTLVYENKLCCANEEVANKTLRIPNITAFREHCHDYSSSAKGTDAVAAHPMCPRQIGKAEACWLEQVVDSDRSVVFVDTDGIQAHEVHVGNTVRNPTEALLVQQLTEALIGGGISEDDIGVISVYRAQLKVLTRLFRHRPLLDIHTVDRYQGKDKECVIVSLVRSNGNQGVGELLKDWRRINVAFTRAKRKLVVFGSRQTLQGSPVFERFLILMEQQNWILRLAPDAQHHHPKLSSQLKKGSVVSKPARYYQELSRLDGTIGDRDDGYEDEDGDMVEIEPEEPDKENIERNQLGQAQASKEVKVLRAKENVVLKGLPIMKNIFESI